MGVAALLGLLLILTTPWTALVSRSVASSADGNALLQVIRKWQLERPPSWTGDDPCSSSWKGVGCDGNLRVTYLDLSNTGIIGDVPIEIQGLDALAYLNVSNSPNNLGAAWNHVTGDLSALAALTQLKILYVGFNALNTEFPKAVLQLTALTDLRLDNAGLTGPFPEGLSNLGQLQFLYLGNSSMSGSLPAELGSLLNLQELSLWKNTLISSIPVELGNLANLKYLNLHDCSLYGSLPSEFGKLKSIEKLHLYSNALTGSVPDAWGNMQNLQELRLQNNFLTKQFPSWIENLQSLQSVDISYNDFYGSVTNISSNHLKALNIACNFFTGSTPTGPSTLNLTDAQNCFGKDSQADNRILCRNSYTCTEFIKDFSTPGGCPSCPVTPYLQVPSTETSSCVCVKEGEDATTKSENNTHTSGILIGSVVGGTLLLFAVLGMLAWKKMRVSKGTPNEKTTSMYGSKFNAEGSQDFWEAPQGVQRFSLKELVQATAGFDSDHQIGVGGFGKVFYGVLASGKKVAIKRASATSMQGTTEFRNEVVLLSRLHHRNLVHLEGFCEDNELQILVYEFVPNGNLHTHLFQRNAASSFNWLRRLDVAVGIAQGLDYLHSFAEPPVIHRDVKPSNILLDSNLVAKVADFGISKSTLYQETHVSTTPAGTAGYIDPQYFLRRHLTTASDVYGFGVVLLELVTGQKAIDPTRLEDNNLVEWVKVKLKVEGVEAIVDPRMGDTYPVQVYQDVVRLAVDCAAFNKNERPTMKTAVAVLDNCLRAVCPAPPRVIDAAPERHLSAGRSAIQILVNEEAEQERSDGLTFSSTVSASKSAFQGSSLLPR